MLIGSFLTATAPLSSANDECLFEALTCRLPLSYSKTGRSSRLSQSSFFNRISERVSNRLSDIQLSRLEGGRIAAAKGFNALSVS